MKLSLFLLSLLLTAMIPVFANNDSAFVETKITLHTKTGDLFGTLTMTEQPSKTPVALIIAGSGPTDRDGNNPFTKNDHLKKLAHALAAAGIASLRFDKRAIAESRLAGSDENKLRFDDYVGDAKEWITLLKKDNRFSEVIVIGHSEGSLIGMMAAGDAGKYISIAGAGQSADKTLKIQLNNQPKQIQDIAFPIIDSLKNGNLVSNVTPLLFALFRPSVQPYLISWFKFNPSDEIQKLKIPVLIIQGTNDIQVSVENAQQLSKAYPAAKLVLVENMNHIFRKVVGNDRQANIKTYSDPSMPIEEELVSNIVSFIKVK